jgi:hypothetical protein
MYDQLCCRGSSLYGMAFSVCIAAGCSSGPPTFDDLVHRAQGVAAHPGKITGVTDFSVSVVDSDDDARTITFEIVEVFGASSLQRAVVAWEFRGDAWRVQFVTTDWSELGSSSIIAEQAIIDSICRQLDPGYVPPPPDPQKSAEMFDSIARGLQALKAADHGRQPLSEAPLDDGDSPQTVHP